MSKNSGLKHSTCKMSTYYVEDVFDLIKHNYMCKIRSDLKCPEITICKIITNGRNVIVPF